MYWGADQALYKLDGSSDTELRALFKQYNVVPGYAPEYEALRDQLPEYGMKFICDVEYRKSGQRVATAMVRKLLGKR